MSATHAAPPLVRRSREADLDGIRAVMVAAFPVDHMPGHTEADIDSAIVHLRIDPDGTAVALEGDRVVGYITPRLDDLTVHPDHRRRGHGRRLVAEGRRIAGERGWDHLTLHGPQHLPATRAFIDALGFRYFSSLWRFALPPEVPVPDPVFPPELAVRGLAPDDLAAFVDLLNDSFADHPTPLSWTLDAVRHHHSLPGFDPSGILLVTPASAPHELVAFARVELRPTRVGGRPVGEVRLIGVRPAWRGRGLGRELLRWGIGHQRARGAGVVELSVEALNETATRIYRAAGFVPSIEWPHYVLDADSSSDSVGGPSR